MGDERFIYLYGLYLQIKVEEESLNFLLALITLKYSQNSIFDEFLKMMKNTLALTGRNWVITYLHFKLFDKKKIT